MELLIGLLISSGLLLVWGWLLHHLTYAYLKLGQR